MATEPDALATTELSSAVAQMWHTKEGADYTILCDGDSYAVHSALLTSRSTFFKSACGGSFKVGQQPMWPLWMILRKQESNSRQIDLKDVSSPDVERMLRFCYGLDYSDSFAEKEANLNSRSYTNASMYAVGERYDLDGLKKVAAAKFRHSLPLFFKASTPGGMGQKLEALADLVYTTTPDSDRTLRDTLCKEMLVAWKSVSKYLELEQIFEKHPRVAVDLLNTKHGTKEVTKIVA